MTIQAILEIITNLPALISDAIPAIQALIADAENAEEAISEDVKSAVSTVEAFLKQINPPVVDATPVVTPVADLTAPAPEVVAAS